MSQKKIRLSLLLLLCIALLTVTGSTLALNRDITHEEVAAAEREYSYTTAETVEAGRRAAERYWLYAYTIHEVTAAEREFTYTTAEAVEEGRVAAAAYCQEETVTC